MAADVVHADGIVVEVELGHHGRRTGAETRIRRAWRIGCPQKVAGAGRPGELQGRHPGSGRIFSRAGKRVERPLDGVRMDQAGVDGQRLVGVLAVEAEAHRSASSQDMELTAQPVTPGVIHAEDIDPVNGNIKTRPLQLAMQHLALQRQLLGIGDVLQLAAAAARVEIRTGRHDPRLGRGEHGRRLGSPEVLSSMGDVGLDRLPGDRPLDKYHPAVDPRQRRPAVGELANRHLH